MPKSKKPSLCPEKNNESEKRNPDAQAYKTKMEIDVLARTLWGEARGEGDEGMKAVACVVMNRIKIAQENKDKYWWGGTIIDVCQKPYQFSCWNYNDPNREKLLSVNDTDLYFATARRIAQRGLLGFLPDITEGATHYHTAGISPYWTRKMNVSAMIGNHIFYREI